jgi:hypothetical protein
MRAERILADKIPNVLLDNKRQNKIRKHTCAIYNLKHIGYNIYHKTVIFWCVTLLTLV